MNTKHLRHLIPIIVIHLFFIYRGGYFLSPEFTVYPYLTSLGLKPYLDLIDQHLPVILFGPISLPKILTSNPQPLLGLFLGLVAITDGLFFYLLKKNKVRNASFWTIIFASSLFLFSGNTLWLETFTIPIILSLFLLGSDQTSQLFTGILTSLVILIRPTLAPSILLLLFFKKLKLSKYLVVGLLFPVLVSATYIIHYQLVSDFTNLFINFNSQYYSILATKAPSLRQLLLSGVIIIPVLLALIKRKKYLPSLIVASSLLPAWPRFELIHLQPAIALCVYFFSLANRKKGPSLFAKAWLLSLLVLSVNKLATASYGNFYLTSEVLQVSQFIKQSNSKQIFVLGGSDLIYPVSGTAPVGNYYLPSLPWYYSNKEFVARQLQVLNNSPQSLVVVNQGSSVDGLKLNIFAKPVLEYVSEEYYSLHTIGSYKIYKVKP